jgi:putative Ig domain-containing protein
MTMRRVSCHRTFTGCAVGAAIAFATACGGSGDAGSGNTQPVTAPANLSYSARSASYTVGTAIGPNTPSSSGGAVTSYTVQPALPAGLILNGTTGVISGTPTAVTVIANYVVTAANSGGTATTTITISVRRGIASFVAGSDITLTYPNVTSDPNHLADFPDEHTTFIPNGAGPNIYLVFGASKIASAPTGGAVVLQTSDLQTFTFATGVGYARQVFTPPAPIDACNSSYAADFDENYAAPGSVVQDPTLPAGNFIMLYEAENHCPGGVIQHPFYATVGFARSSDAGKTWPAVINSVLGGPARHPVLKAVNPQPTANYTTPMGNAIPSGFVDKSASGDYYLYVVYGYHDGGLAPSSDNMLRMARAKLGADPLTFSKWYNGGFTQTGIGGLDSGVLPTGGCTPGTLQQMGEVTYNDDLGEYLFIFVCTSGPSGNRVASWYYSTATSLDAQDWAPPLPIANTQSTVTIPCPGLTTGQQYDGYYPSFMSPGAAAGHTKLTGKAFFLSGCDTGVRTFMARTFTITVQQ